MPLPPWPKPRLRGIAGGVAALVTEHEVAVALMAGRDHAIDSPHTAPVDDVARL